MPRSQLKNQAPSSEALPESAERSSELVVRRSFRANPADVRAMYEAELSLIRFIGQCMLDSESPDERELLATQLDKILDTLRETCEPQVRYAPKIPKAPK